MGTIETITNKNGKKIDFDFAVNYMNDELREELHNKIAPCEAQEFFNAYAEAHEDKFGEEWIAQSANPVW